jgi:hypothetical protein
MKVLATHFRKVLIDDRTDENILDEIMGEWYEFEVMRKVLPLLDPLHKVCNE